MIAKYKIYEFAKERIEGTLVKTPKGVSRLIRKYPYIAHCEDGYWSWVEIYLAENGYRLPEHKKLKGENHVTDVNI